MPTLAEKINVEKAFALPLFRYTNNQFTRISNFSLLVGIKNALLVVKKSVFTNPCIVNRRVHAGCTLYLRYHQRNDLDEASGCFESAINSTTVCLFSQRVQAFDPFSIVGAISVLFHKKCDISLLFRMYNVELFSEEGLCLLLGFLDSISDLLKILPLIQNCSRVVSFQESISVENLACQVANSFGIPTFALQHSIGIYSLTGSYRARCMIMMYMPTVCKNILVWGEYSRNIFKLFTNSPVFLVGKPALPSANFDTDGLTFIFESDDRINAKLLKISDFFLLKGREVSRWFKPGFEPEAGVTRDGPLRRMIIGMKSSLIFELGYLGAHVFVIAESPVADILPRRLVINTLDDAEREYLSADPYPHHVWKRFIDCTGRESIDRYNRVLGYESS
jgi:hypothetical protein